MAQNDRFFLGLVKAAYRHDPSNNAGREMFQSAQWAIGSQAAGALAQMSARQTAGSGELADMVRERQDSVREWQGNEKRMNTLRGAGKNDEKLEVQMDAIDRRIAEIDKMLAKEFPDYAALASPKPLTVKQVQKLLKPDEILILLLDTAKTFSGSKQITPAETFIWAVTRKKAVWKRAELGGEALADHVAALRCGLDSGNWADPVDWSEADDQTVQDEADEIGLRNRQIRREWLAKAKIEQQARRNSCIKLIGKVYSDKDLPPFDLKRAHLLYQKLLAPVEDIIKNKHLLLVTSGPLTGLPFQVLVTQKPAQAIPDDVDSYKQAAWLTRRHAITTLPSVSALMALRGIAKSGKPAPQPLLGFADPVFSPEASASDKVRVASRNITVGNYAGFFRGRNVDPATFSNLSSLPGTRTELEQVGKILEVDEKHLLFGRAASEKAVKAARLDQYRIIYFATHGLIAGEIKGLGEPALAFSLPETFSKSNDGLLTASEVAILKMNADWVVMSACNTAAGQKPGAEALSGLARAFFYAGAKTLLVSHWPVGD